LCRQFDSGSSHHFLPSPENDSTLPLVGRALLALGLNFALCGPAARPGEENHHQQDCDEKHFTVVHHKFSKRSILPDKEERTLIPRQIVPLPEGAFRND
jgi:hypothetical protein